MRRADPERIYQAQRAGFAEGVASRLEATRERATAVLDALEAQCEALGLERGSPEFWREAERRMAAARYAHPSPATAVGLDPGEHRESAHRPEERRAPGAPSDPRFDP